MVVHVLRKSYHLLQNWHINERSHTYAKYIRFYYLQVY